MNASNVEIGRKCEDIASLWLINNGFEIVARNFRSRHGEIDIIAKESDILCFIEVKARGSNRLASGAYAINARKQKCIIQTARYYLHITGKEDLSMRFDVIIMDQDGKELSIELIRDAFRPGW